MPTYRIYKQLIPAPLDEKDPHWAKRQVCVAKLNEQDSIDDFNDLHQPEQYAQQLSDADPTSRIYEVRQIH